MILSSALSRSALTTKVLALTPRWRLSSIQVKSANGDDYESESKFLEASYCQDVDTGILLGQLSVLEAMLKISRFYDILLAVTKVPEPEKKLVRKSKLFVSCLV